MSDIKRDNRGRFPTRFITWKGETKTLTEWAESTGLRRSLIENRMKRFDKGEISVDRIFEPPTPQKGQHLKNAAGQSPGRPVSGLRVEANTHFFECVKNQIMPLLEEEMKTYALTGEIGKAMKFYKDYKDFLLPRGEIQSLDGGTNQPKANFAVIFAPGTAPPPKNFTIIDP